jgi:DNA replication protein DnaC
MLLYSSTCERFYDDIKSDRIAEIVNAAFRREFGRDAGKGEQRSWHNSLPRFSWACEKAGLGDQGIIIEYQLPQSSKRLDVMLTGANDAGQDSATIIELKQWEECEATDGEKIVTWVGGGHRDVPHPSAQAQAYVMYLADGQTVFHQGPSPVVLNGGAYLHNYSFVKDDPLLAPKFDDLRAQCPLFSHNDQDSLAAALRQTVGAGPGHDVLNRVLRSEALPSKKLLEHIGGMFKGNDEYVLLDDQLASFERVMAEARKALTTGTTSTILIRGGPGTGKSVIALNLVTALARDGVNVRHATGSRAFTGSIRKIVGTRASAQFNYFNTFATDKPGSVDVLICDEAHRIRTTSVNRFTRKDNRSGKEQIEELLDVAKVAVFFIDDLQVVRPGEIGSADLIVEANDVRKRPRYDFQLAAQFRCAGSDGFIAWITDVLGIEETANRTWTGDDGFDFQIVESPERLHELISGKVAEGITARMTAGFCWPWSDPLGDGTLMPDVQVGDWRMPWNAKSDKGRLAPGIPKESDWARDPNGVNQVGCIYTAQGFEFDYCGVIFGTDLVYREGVGWVGQRENSEDRIVKRGGEAFTDLVKNTYRVLLSRGMKGCYVHFVDAETQAYWESRMGTDAQVVSDSVQ